MAYDGRTRLKDTPAPEANIPSWVMLSALIGVAAMSQAFRTIATIMAPGLRSEFDLSPEALALFAGAFHIAFAVAQIPVGLALDLHGARRTVSFAFSFAVLGALISAVAPNLPILIIGQLLIGFGCAPAFVGTLYFVAKHFAGNRFAAVSGVVLSLSGLGLLATGTPLAWLVELWNWRAGFIVMAICAALVLLAILTVVRDKPSGDRPVLRDAVAHIGSIFKERQTLGILILGVVGYSSYIALRGLWGAPMLIERYGFTLTEAGNVLLASSIAALVGPPIFGSLDVEGRQRRYVIIASVTASALAFATLGVSTNWHIDVALYAVLGFLTGFTILQFADVKAAYSSDAAGRAFGIFNTATFLGVALMQWATGRAASLAAAHGIDQFLTAFMVIAATSFAAAAAFFLLPWPAPMKRR